MTDKPMTVGELKGKRLAHGQFVVNNLMKLLNDHTGIQYETLDDKIGFCIELVRCIEEVQLELETKASINSNENRHHEYIKDVQLGEWSVRTSGCLKGENIQTLWDLVSKTENKLLCAPNFGRKSLNEVKEYVERFGLFLGMDLESFEKWLKCKPKA